MTGTPEGIQRVPLVAAHDLPARELLATHGPGMLVAARSIVLDEAEAQDLVQTTFEIALRRLDTLRDPAALRPWLYAILSREAFRAARRLRRLLRLDVAVDLPVDPLDSIERMAIEAALRTLPRRTRTAVVLRHMVGLSVAETATAMGVSENTIKTLLRLGLERLRKALDDA